MPGLHSNPTQGKILRQPGWQRLHKPPSPTEFSVIQQVFPGQFLCPPHLQPRRRNRESTGLVAAPKPTTQGTSRGHSTGSWGPRWGRAQGSKVRALPKESPLGCRRQQAGWKTTPATDSVPDPPQTPDIPDSHRSFL